MAILFVASGLSSDGRRLRFKLDFAMDLDGLEDLTDRLRVPDLWQRTAIQALESGEDVVVDAPTGAGKTFIFEYLIEHGFRGQAVYTVPTRALANDKQREWEERGWRVGILTGDLAYRTDAPVVVATLETQMRTILAGRGPDLLVVDEYQLIDDETRGIHYEQVIAMVPEETRLLLLSGSVANPGEVREWLERIGRRVRLVQCLRRPVPLEAIQSEAVPGTALRGIRGFWPTLIAKALKADLGPILLFAPRRSVAERLARQLAAALPDEDPLQLTVEQAKLARGVLSRMLRSRVAFHHSGLSYPQRAGLVEPLAKAGQLRVIVATTGLAAGINFSVRTVCVTDSEYQVGPEYRRLRPDEILQMYGRAGRRGIDPVGYALQIPGRPGLAEARPVRLRGNASVDWASCIHFLNTAVAMGEDPRRALDRIFGNLFQGVRPVGVVGGDQRGTVDPDPTGDPGEGATGNTRLEITEMRNTEGEWERLGRKERVALGDCLAWTGKRWIPALEWPDTLKAIPYGSLCRLDTTGRTTYGRIVTVASFPEAEGEGRVTLAKWFFKGLRELAKEGKVARRLRRSVGLEGLERDWLPLLPLLTGGGRMWDWAEKSGRIVVRLDYSEGFVFARREQSGRYLLGVPVRKVAVGTDFDFGAALGFPARSAPIVPGSGVVGDWRELGLVDGRLKPTRRGILTSFFHHAEGLAIAVALEDPSYAIEDLIYDLANLRAGHRFEEIEGGSTRLGDVCRIACNWKSVTGYLRRGLPIEYGNGAGEVLRAILGNPQARSEFISERIREGDIERVLLEWRALLRQIVFAPDLEWDPWRELKAAAYDRVGMTGGKTERPELPPLTVAQRQRYVGGRNRS